VADVGSISFCLCLCLYLNSILRAKYFEYTLLHLVSVVLVLFILLWYRNLDVVALGRWLCHERVIPSYMTLA